MVVAANCDVLPAAPTVTPEPTVARDSAQGPAFQDVLQRAQRPPQSVPRDPDTPTPSHADASTQAAPSKPDAANEPNTTTDLEAQDAAVDQRSDGAEEAIESLVDLSVDVAPPPQSVFIQLQALLTAVAEAGQADAVEPAAAIHGQPANHAKATDAAQLLAPAASSAPLQLDAVAVVVSTIVLPPSEPSSATASAANASDVQESLGPFLESKLSAVTAARERNAPAATSERVAQVAGTTTSGAPTLLSDVPQLLRAVGDQSQHKETSPSGTEQSLDPTAAIASAAASPVTIDIAPTASPATPQQAVDAIAAVTPNPASETNPTPTTDPGTANSSAAASQTGASNSSRFTMHAGPRTLAESEGTMPGVSEADRNRLIQRVARAFQSTGPDGGTMRLRLSPPELGSIRVEIQVQGGQMSAKIEAETSTARALLLDNLPALRERLEQQDIKLMRFDVDLFGGSTGNLSQQSQHDPTAEQQGQRVFARRDGAGDTVSGPTNSASAPRSVVGGNGQLNIVI